MMEKGKKTNRTWVVLWATAAVIALIGFLLLLWAATPGGKYAAAQALYRKGQYTQAEKAFAALGDYRDASARKAAAEAAQIINLKPGDSFHFGSYEQNGDLADGQEPIQWLILQQEGNRVLAISVDILDCQSYNSQWDNVTWSNCSLRAWLNDTFLTTAFTVDEQAFLAPVENSNPDNERYAISGGPETVDRVFLLSQEEAETYFPSDGARAAAVTPLAQEQGVYLGAEDTGIWWLRSPGENENHAAIVNYWGQIHTEGHLVNLGQHGIRPVIWLEIELP